MLTVSFKLISTDKVNGYTRKNPTTDYGAQIASVCAGLVRLLGHIDIASIAKVTGKSIGKLRIFP